MSTAAYGLWRERVGKWREANKRRQVQTAIHRGVMPPPPPPQHTQSCMYNNPKRPHNCRTFARFSDHGHGFVLLFLDLLRQTPGAWPPSGGTPHPPARAHPSHAQGMSLRVWPWRSICPGTRGHRTWTAIRSRKETNDSHGKTLDRAMGPSAAVAFAVFRCALRPSPQGRAEGSRGVAFATPTSPQW